MEEINNPYIAGAPVTEKRMFFGREDVFDWIERSLSGHILVVHGQRRVGKTSVLKQLGNRLPDRYIPVFFDLQGRTNTTLDRFLLWLASGIVRALKQERDITVPPPDKELFTQDSDYFENRFLPDLKLHLGEGKVLLLTFDEFDNLEEGGVKDALARPLIDYLRRLMGHSNLNFIFSIGSSGRKLENMQAAYTEFFKAALYKKISFLTKDDGHRLITMPVQGVLEYEKDAVQQIYEIVSGHPYFTQLICHELFSQCQKTGKRAISRADVDSILDDVVERGTVNLKFVWDEAADLEKWALSGLAQLEGKHNNRAIADFLNHQRVRFNQQALDSALLHLRERDILTDDNRFVNHLLQIWMKKNRPIEQAREELTEVNPIANRYIEIGLEYKNSRMHEKAIESFKEALEVDSDNLQAQVSLALVYLDQKNIEKAIAEFEKALQIDDEDIATRSGLCDAYLAQGDQARAMARPREADAIKAYQKILAINGEHNEARQRMAEINRQRAEKALADGKDEAALSAFSEALKYTPEDPSLIERVEQVRAEKKAKVLAAQIARSEKEANARNWDKAIAALNEALETSPNDESILKKIAVIKERQMKERLDALLTKADQAEKSSRWDAAISTLNEYLSLKPGDSPIQKRLDDLIEAKHATWLNAIIARADQAAAYLNWDEAIAALNEVLVREPDNTEIQKKAVKVREMRRTAELNALFKRVEAAVQVGRWDDAINDLNNGIASEPENESLQSKLAEVRKGKREARRMATMRLVDNAIRVGNWDAAIGVLNEILAIEPENAEFQHKLTEVREARRTAELNALLKRVENAVQARHWDEAINDLNHGIASEPENETLRSKLIEVQKAKREARLKATLRLVDNATQSGNWDAAITALNEILAVEPENAEFQKKLVETKKGQRESRLSSFRTQARGFAKAEKFEESLAAWNEYLMLDPDDGGGTQAEIESVKKAQRLAQTYAEAYKAYSKRNYEKAISLFKSIVVEDTDYKDATRLLSESIELRRTTRKWWQSKWLWSGVGGLAVLMIGWFVLQPESTLMNALFASTVAPITTDAAATTVTGGNSATEIPTHAPTPTPTPLPFSWARLNSGQFLSRDQITAIVFDPTDPGVIYVGMENAGIYKSIDSGISWQPAQNGLKGKSIHSLVIDPNNPSILFAGVLQGGVYKTEDGGANWRAINEGINVKGWEIISHVLLDPTDSQHLLYTNSFVSDGGILYESLDGGESWQNIMRSKDIMKSNCPDRTSDIAMHPHNNQILISGSQSDSACSGGVYLTEDGGHTWGKIGLQGINIKWVAISTTKDDNELIYAQTDDESDLFGSSDRGQTWVSLCTSYSCKPLTTDSEGNVVVFSNNGNITRSSGIQPNWQTVSKPELMNNSLLVFSPLQPNTLLLGGSGLSMSTDGGKSWVLQNSGLGAKNFNLQLTASPDEALYLMQEGNSSYISLDLGRTWENIFNTNGIPSLFSIAGNLVYKFKFRHNEAAYSTDQGQTWTNISLPLPNVDSLGIYPQSSERVFAAYGGQAVRLFYSDDRGTTWSESKISCYSNCSDWGLFFQPGINQNERLSIRGDQFPFISDDNGLTWNKCSWSGTWIAHSPSAVAIDPSHKEKLFLATNGEGVAITSDSCQSWQDSNTGLDSLFVNTVAIDPNNPNNVYTGTDGGAYISSDGGKTWGQVNDGLLGATVVYSIVIDKDSNVYAATPYGIFILEKK